MVATLEALRLSVPVTVNTAFPKKLAVGVKLMLPPTMATVPLGVVPRVPNETVWALSFAGPGVKI